MNTLELLKNIGTRTNNDIYVGVVGPVRVGKSTFIRKFMELVVIDNITDESEKRRISLENMMWLTNYGFEKYYIVNDRGQKLCGYLMKPVMLWQ